MASLCIKMEDYDCVYINGLTGFPLLSKVSVSCMHMKNFLESIPDQNLVRIASLMYMTSKRLSVGQGYIL